MFFLVVSNASRNAAALPDLVMPLEGKLKSMNKDTTDSESKSSRDARAEVNCGESNMSGRKSAAPAAPKISYEVCYHQ